MAKPALTGHIEIQNAAEFETALMCVERLMEVAEDSELDPLDPLISMLFTAIQAWEAKDPALAVWDSEISAEVETEYLLRSPANRQHLERSIAQVNSAAKQQKKVELKKLLASVTAQIARGKFSAKSALDIADEVINEHQKLELLKSRFTGIAEQEPKVPNAVTREALTESEDIDQLERISSIDETLKRDAAPDEKSTE